MVRENRGATVWRGVSCHDRRRVLRRGESREGVMVLLL